MSSPKPYKRAVAVTGTYTDREGNEKKRYVTVGTLMQYDDGNFTLKLDAVPTAGWDGWLAFYDIDDRRQPGTETGTGHSSKSSGGGAKGYGSQRTGGGMDDDIPFITSDSVR